MPILVNKNVAIVAAFFFVKFCIARKNENCYDTFTMKGEIFFAKMNFIKSLFLWVVFCGIIIPNVSWGAVTEDTYCKVQGYKPNNTIFYSCVQKTNATPPDSFITCYFDKDEGRCGSCYGYDKYFQSGELGYQVTPGYQLLGKIGSCFSCPSFPRNTGQYYKKSESVPFDIESCRMSKNDGVCLSIYKYVMTPNTGGEGSYERDESESVVAPAGAYIKIENGVKQCAECVTDKPYSNGGNIGIEGCTACDQDGYYVDNNSCKICPPGYECPNNQTMQSCSQDYYSYAGVKACLPCAEDYTTYGESEYCSTGGVECTSSKACHLRTLKFKSSNNWLTWPNGIIQGKIDKSKAKKNP